MDNCTELTEQQRVDALLAIGLTGLVAVIICLTAIVLLFLFKLYKYFAHRLALYQVVGALGYATALTFQLLNLNYYDNTSIYKPICQTIGFLAVYFSWIKLLFTTWIIFHLFCFSVLYKNLQRFEIGFIFFSTCFPLLFVWVPFLYDSFGLAGPWCWIKASVGKCIVNTSTNGIVEQFSLWFGPAIVCSILDCVAIFAMVYVLVSNRSDQTLILNYDQKKKALKELLPLLAYPILFCILLLPPLANRIYSASTKVTNFDLILVSAVFIPLQSLCAGLTLVVHICYIKCSKCFIYCHKLSINPEELPINTCTETNCTTVAVIPAESEVDRALLTKSAHFN